MLNPNGAACANETQAESPAKLHRCEIAKVGVMQTADETKLVAVARIRAGERLFELEGVTTARPSRYSLQIDEHLHLDTANSESHDVTLLRHFWRFMNHSCDPTTVVQDRAIIAQRDIEPGEAVTFDYNTTEWSMAEPFACRCESANCLKEIRGYKHLSAAQRARLRGVAPYLMRIAQKESREPASQSA